MLSSASRQRDCHFVLSASGILSAADQARPDILIGFLKPRLSTADSARSLEELVDGLFSAGGIRGPSSDSFVGGMIEAQITSQGLAHRRGQVDRDCECRVASCGLGPEPQWIIIRGMILEVIIEKFAREPVAPGA